MAMRKKRHQQKPPVKQVVFDSKHHAGTFDLSFLHPQEPPMSYENELLTAEEKAAYYEDLIQNNGFENSEKIARDCIKKASTLMKKLDALNEDEALPLRERIVGLEALAEYLKNEVPPDVLAAQRGADDDMDYGVDGKASGKIAELQKKRQFWKEIHNWSADERMAYYFTRSGRPAEWTEAVFVRAQKDKDAVMVLSWEARHSMLRLLDLAEMGNEVAAIEAVAALEKYVRLLNVYAKTNADVFKKVAGRIISWPVAYSSHPRLNQIPQNIATQLKLGQEMDFEFSPNTKWVPSEKGCKIAMHLYEHIKLMRQFPESNEHSPCLDKAMELPNIKQSGAVKAWWSVAREVLLTGYPKPEEDKELRSLTKIKNRFKVRDKILECIENRFFSLFPKGSR